MQPNPCVAPLERTPFYAVKVVPGDLGTFAGLRGDAPARVLDRGGRPIPGLYAAGNDLSSVMGGNYPGGGITLGPAMTFGYIAAHHIAARDGARGHEGTDGPWRASTRGSRRRHPTPGGDFPSRRGAPNGRAPRIAARGGQ